MKNSRKKEPDKTASDGKGDSPESKQISCKCTHDCCCPNSKYYKGPKKHPIKEIIESAVHLPQIVKKKVSGPELQYSECPCEDQFVVGKGKFRKSEVPCTKEKDCSCILPINAQSLRHKVHELDDALKAHGRGKKRKTKNVQRKSIQVSEIYEDPQTKKKSIVTLTEKSQVKIQIKTFCDDTRKLEKNKKGKRRRKSSDTSSRSSTNKEKKPKVKKEKRPSLQKEKRRSLQKDKRSKEKKPKKEKRPKAKQKKKLFGCFRKKRRDSVSSYSSRESDVSVIYQTGGQPCKDGPCLGIKAFSKTEKGGEGFVNTNTVIFPENFTGNLKELAGCDTCKALTSQLNQQTEEISDIRKSINECLKILQSNGQAVYMTSDMTGRSNPNYYTVYSHASHKKLGRDDKVSEHTYDPEYKVRDWITHGSLTQVDLEDVSHKQGTRNIKGSANNKGCRIPDKFDSELEEYLKICRHEYQVYKSSKEAKPKVKKRRSASKTTPKKTKKSKKSKKGSDKNVLESPSSKTTGVLKQGPQCDRSALDCKCGPECEHLGVQTSNVSTNPSKKSKDSKKSKKKSSKKDKKGKKKKSKDDSVSLEGSSIGTEKSGDSVLSRDVPEDPLAKDAKGKDIVKIKKPGCLGKFLKCILCRPY